MESFNFFDVLIGMMQKAVDEAPGPIEREQSIVVQKLTLPLIATLNNQAMKDAPNAAIVELFNHILKGVCFLMAVTAVSYAAGDEKLRKQMYDKMVDEAQVIDKILAAHAIQHRNMYVQQEAKQNTKH